MGVTTTPRDYGIAPEGYRLPDTTRLGRVKLQVADLERSLAYYTQVLGLRVLDRRDEGGRVARLAPNGEDVVLVELVEKRGVQPSPERGRLGLYHFAILLPDRGSLGRFLRHLGESNVRAGMADHLVSEAIYLEDPDGLGIEVYADRPRSAWRSEGRQLVMATEHLDVGDLLRAGGAEPWSGMPRGTVIGHVHLFVGDLARASSFYHDALGFEKVVWNYPGALFLSAGGYHHHLGTNTWARHAKPATDDDARLLEWEIVLPAEDVTAAAASVERKGMTVEREGGGVAVRDPWGTRVRLVAPG
ncbi:MAG TPA: VOC family protein [Gemmatimonadaceae bacterium]